MSEYDVFAQNFSQSRQAGWPEFELLRPLVHEGERVLDLGCGNGRLRKILTEQGVASSAYFGLDASDELLKIAKENYPDDHFFEEISERHFLLEPINSTLLRQSQAFIIC